MRGVLIMDLAFLLFAALAGFLALVLHTAHGDNSSTVRTRVFRPYQAGTGSGDSHLRRPNADSGVAGTCVLLLHDLGQAGQHSSVAELEQYFEGGVVERPTQAA